MVGVEQVNMHCTSNIIEQQPLVEFLEKESKGTLTERGHQALLQLDRQTVRWLLNSQLTS